MRILFFTFLISLFSNSVFSQDLLKERIRKLTSNKTSVYIEKGIFHNGGVKVASSLKAVRQSYNPKQGFERIVLDFSTDQLPKIYGHISSVDQKIYLDLFESTLAPDLKTISVTRYIEKMNLFPIESNHVSLEMKLKSKVIADIFYLENPARLVIDLKN